jgi:hypothetical protein
LPNEAVAADLRRAAFLGQPEKLFARLTAPKTFLPFTDAEGAGEHCQSGAVALADARIFDWLDVTLG